MRTAAAVLLLAMCAACSRDRKAEQIAALDNALRSGLITKQEYDAKKASVLGTPPPAPVVAQAPAPLPAVSPAPTPAPPLPPELPADVSRKTAPKPVEAPPAKTHAAAPAPTPVKTAPAPVERAASPPPPPPPSTPPPSEAGVPRPKPEPPKPAAADEEEPKTLAGCEDAPRPGKEKGLQERFFPASVARVKDAARSALAGLEFKVNKDAGNEIDANKKRHLGVLVGSGGERIILRFEEAREGGQRGTRVTGETKKGFLLRAGQKSWTNAVLAQTACLLGKK